MSAFELIALVAGYALAATKFLNTVKPYWGKLPKFLSALLPSMVVLLPAVADRLGSLHNVTDLKVLGAAALALLLPGWHGSDPKVEDANVKPLV